MFDDNFKPYLIEVNTNPCLDQPCPLLARLIPAMLDNALRYVPLLYNHSPIIALRLIRCSRRQRTTP